MIQLPHVRSPQNNLRVYANAFLLSPMISYYRGKLPEALIDALCELSIASLPPNKEAAQCKQVAAQIGKHLTTARNALKTQIKASVKDETNLAVLASAIIGKSDIKPTVQLYMRLAFLRWHMLNFPNLPAEDWWFKVDDTLVKWRTKWTSEVQITNDFPQGRACNSYGPGADLSVVLGDKYSPLLERKQTCATPRSVTQKHGPKANK
ncbi:hypothetical protein PILCRDRAFT_16488 [Piloderma croceum F 1598]|uniref:Uncharacterized protein n=1 Tax=Piloderma croceum (strain F 1598) TaxID=765440 RepID=A0A0C3EVL8_PILCF|nr:hypothetical protein PILCRDRAFT_16488 [Piloderma croceum F 1598]